MAIVIHRRVRKSKLIHAVTTVGISNNVGEESKAHFIADALRDYARRSRGTLYSLKEMAEARRS